MRSNLSRKIIYGLIIVAILGAMIPYTNWLQGVKKDKDLGEAAIGQVDTGSFMLKLALLGGARGIAANVLWTRAEELKREHDWDRMKATIDLITKLQPHFLSVWTFQGWNLAYNVSVEWDAPEDKYDWIKKGIQFLEDGVKKNTRSPDLIWDTAWTYYHKLGFADESIILRRLFRDDDDEDFKKYIDYSDPQQPLIVGNDNFKLGFGWFSRAVALVDEERPDCKKEPATSNSSTRRPSAKGGRVTSPSARCPLTPRLGTPPAWRRRASWTSPPPSARSPRTSGPRRSPSGRSSANIRS